MKKRIFIVAIALCAILVLTGCGKKNDTLGFLADDQNGVTSVSSKEDFEALQEKSPDAFSCMITLPEIYQKNCEPTAGDGEIKGSYFITFCDTQNRQANCGGILFSLHFTPVGQKIEFANGKVLGQVKKDGKAVYDLYIEYPSDVQYDIQNEDLTKNYEDMRAEEQALLDSLQFANGYTLALEAK